VFSERSVATSTLKLIFEEIFEETAKIGLQRKTEINFLFRKIEKKTEHFDAF
jgi:hypothetical protein